MYPNRVLITGWAVRSGFGDTVDSLWRAVNPGPTTPVRSLPFATDDFASLPNRFATRLDAPTNQALLAAQDAWSDAGSPDVDPFRMSVRVGVVYGGIDGVARAARDAAAVRPHLAVEVCENTPAAAIATMVNAQGTVRSVSSACASSADAILEAAHDIRAGRADIAIAGGTQGPIPDFLLTAYEQLRVLSPDGMVRPFDVRRNGFRFGEASAFVLLESADHCRARNGRVLAQFLGGFATNDAASLTTPNGVGLAAAIRGALGDAGVSRSEIQHVNSHGTGTRSNDSIEAKVFAGLLGNNTPVAATKAVTGHTSAACGALELILASIALQKSTVPPCSVDFQRDPEIDIDVVHSEPRHVSGRAALSTSVGLGGQNTALVVGLPE